MRKLFAMVFVMMLLTVSTPRTAYAADYTDAPSLIDGVLKVVDGVKDYSMVVYAKMPAGEWVFDYRCDRMSATGSPTIASDIRTQILDGSYRGAVLLSLPREKANMIKIQVGKQQAWRLTRKLKLTETPVVESVLDKFSQDFKEYKFSMRAHQKVSVEVGKNAPPPPPDKQQDDQVFGGNQELEETLKAVPPPTFHHEIVQKDCYVLKGSKGDLTEEIAFDSQTLLPVSIKRWTGKTLDLEAQIWEMKLNPGLKIEF